MNYFSSNLKYLRKVKSLTLADIGDYIKRRGNTVGNWEKGHFEPSISELELIAQFFNLTIEQLLYVDLKKEAYDTNRGNVFHMIKRLEKKLPSGEDNRFCIIYHFGKSDVTMPVQVRFEHAVF